VALCSKVTPQASQAGSCSMPRPICNEKEREREREKERRLYAVRGRKRDREGETERGRQGERKLS
jgi:hypothetical protein